MSKFHKKPVKFVSEIVLRVEDINRSKRFYKEIMGLSILQEKARELILSTDGKLPLITIIQPDDIIAKLPRRAGLYHYAILLPSKFYLGLFLKHLRDNKYPIIGGSDHGVSNAIYLRDPDDIEIEVYADTFSSQEMTSQPLDYEELISSTGDQVWDTMPKESIIGHIHLHVGDLEEAGRFYIDGLGFSEVTRMANSALFLSDGGYHHHIGLNIWNGKNAPPTPKNAVGMEFYTLLLPDKASRDDLMDNLRNLEYEVFEDKDKIFTKDPSDNIIELRI